MIKNHPNFCTFLKTELKRTIIIIYPFYNLYIHLTEVQIIRWNETSRGIAYFRDDGHPPFSYKSGTVSNWLHLCTPRERELLRGQSRRVGRHYARLTMGQGEATRLRNNRGRRNAEFRRAGKYRVILTVIAGGLTHHN